MKGSSMKSSELISHALLLIVSLLFVISCSSGGNSIAGGFGSETSNGVVATSWVLTSQDTLENIEVKLIPDNFNPAQESDARVRTSRLNSSGEALFEDVEYGSYNVIASNSTGTRKKLIYNIVVDDETPVNRADTLKNCGQIELKFEEEPSSDRFECYLPGTTIKQPFINATANVDGTYSLLFDKIPAGDIEPFYAYQEISQNSFVITEPGVVEPDIVVEFLVNLLWHNYQKDASGKSLGHISSNIITPNGDAWFTQVGAVIKIDNSGIISRYSSSDIGLPLLPVLNSGYDRDETILFSTPHGVIANRAGVWEEVNFFSDNFQTNKIIYQCVDTTTNDHWFTSLTGVRRWNSGTLDLYDIVTTETGEEVDLRTANSISVDSRGTVWIGTDISGVVKYENGRWNRPNQALPSHRVTNIISGIEGRVIITTSTGLVYFNGTGWKRFDSSNSPLGNCINAIAHNNRLWVVSNNSMYQFNGAEWLELSQHNSPLISGEVVSISINERDKRGYVATKAGILGFDY